MVQGDDVTEKVAHNHRHHWLIPEVTWYKHWKNAPDQQHQWNVEAALKSNNWISPNVRHINEGTFLFD